MFQAFSIFLSALAPASQLQTALEKRPISSVGQVRADLSLWLLSGSTLQIQPHELKVHSSSNKQSSKFLKLRFDVNARHAQHRK